MLVRNPAVALRRQVTSARGTPCHARPGPGVRQARPAMASLGLEDHHRRARVRHPTSPDCQDFGRTIFVQAPTRPKFRIVHGYLCLYMVYIDTFHARFPTPPRAESLASGAALPTLGSGQPAANFLLACEHGLPLMTSRSLGSTSAGSPRAQRPASSRFCFLVEQAVDALLSPIYCAQKMDEPLEPDRSGYQGNNKPRKPRSKKNAAANQAIIALMQRDKGEVQTCNRPTCSALKRDGKPAIATAQWRTDDRWCRECWVCASGSSTHRLLRESMQVH